MSMPFVKTLDGFTTVVANKPYNISSVHENYAALFKAVSDGEEQKFLDNLTPDAKLVRIINNAPIFVKSDVKFVDGEVTYKSIPLAGVEVERIKQYAKDKIPFEPILRFVENRMESPSPEAIKQLYVYLEKHKLPLTKDGCFLAYKAIRQDWMDKYSGTISNHIGAKPNMKREAVDNDSNSLCSHGLHVGALAYSGPGGWYWSNGDRVVICKINPRDVISVPNDHNGQKMRVCEYEVVAEYEYDLTESLYDNGRVMTKEDFEEEYNDEENDIDFEDDFEDEDTSDVVNREKVSAYTLKYGELVEFSYNGTIRTLRIEDVDDEHVSGNLYINDSDLWSEFEELLNEATGTQEYKTFKKERMRGVYKLV